MARACDHHTEQIRATATTASNAESSRSHAILVLTLTRQTAPGEVNVSQVSACRLGPLA
eukprot:COSAG01_NODE_11412_length_1940_cov_1.611081_3_plen_58_part_01